MASSSLLLSSDVAMLLQIGDDGFVSSHALSFDASSQLLLDSSVSELELEEDSELVSSPLPEDVFSSLHSKLLNYMTECTFNSPYTESTFEITSLL